MDKPWINSLYRFLNCQFYLKMKVCPKQTNPATEYDMHTFFKNKTEDIKKKGKTI